MALRFMVMGDARITNSDTDLHNQRMQRFISHCNNLYTVAPTKLDFIAFMGDNVECPSGDGCPDNNNFTKFKSILKGLNRNIGLGIAPGIKGTEDASGVKAHAFIINGNHDGEESIDLTTSGKFNTNFGFIPEQFYIFQKLKEGSTTEYIKYQIIIPALRRYNRNDFERKPIFTWSRALTIGPTGNINRRTIVMHHAPAVLPAGNTQSYVDSRMDRTPTKNCNTYSTWTSSAYAYPFNSTNKIYDQLIKFPNLSCYICGHTHIHNAQMVTIKKTVSGITTKRTFLHYVGDSFNNTRCDPTIEGNAQSKVGYIKIDDNGTRHFALVQYEYLDTSSKWQTMSFKDPFTNYVCLTSLSGDCLNPPSGNIKRGTPFKITWNIIGTPSSKVQLDLMKAGKIYKTITTSALTSNKYYNWTPSSTETIASDYRIRIGNTGRIWYPRFSGAISISDGATTANIDTDTAPDLNETDIDYYY